MDCHAARRTLLLDLYGEIATEERRILEVHLGACDECRLAAAGERRLHAILGERIAEEPSDELLDRCRRDLSLALEAEPRPLRLFTQRLTAFWGSARLSPAWGLALLIAGFLAGAATLRGDARNAGQNKEIGAPAGGGTVASSLPTALVVRAPNPLVAGDALRFGLPRAGHVDLALVSVTGRVVARLADGEFAAGWHDARVPSGLVPGVYFARLSSPFAHALRRLVLVR
jgi:anti-sigma factor RsiW